MCRSRFSEDVIAAGHGNLQRLRNKKRSPQTEIQFGFPSKGFSAHKSRYNLVPFLCALYYHRTSKKSNPSIMHLLKSSKHNLRDQPGKQIEKGGTRQR
jgi:hypothetical protein